MESNRFEVQGIPIVDVIQTEIPQSGSQAKQTNTEVALSEVQVSDTQGTQIPDDRKSQQFWSLWGMKYIYSTGNRMKKSNQSPLYLSYTTGNEYQI